ncbi:hypothetical protein OIO90_003834 [Microbotryomycetes sp. JL221]|nr:hypothetical protein OIO90_003834 [Microbotryomycetes sp. JL221]
MPFGYTHTTLRALAKGATQSFFARIHVEFDQDNVPRDGPVIVVANHHNSAVDPAMLSCFFPYGRKLHYWAKSTLFKPGLARTILLDAGNIPVDRKTKDNQKLFATTFDVLKQGECVAVFPEGGSETMTALPPLKDGASWAALEYAINVRRTGKQLSDGTFVKHEPKDVVICIAGINFTDKTKYRSSAIMQFGPPIHVGPYLDEFEKEPKSAVKRLTRDIATQLTKLTINAPDWDSLHAATMARKMLWIDEQTIPLTNYRDIMQTLVNMFATAPSNRKVSQLRDILLSYKTSLETTSLTHSSLSGVPLPSTLDPDVPHPLPTRFKILSGLIWSTLASLSILPFFVVPLAVHLPVYLVGSYSLKISDVDEDIAQNKISLGLILAIVVYLSLFTFIWTLLVVVPFGGFLAALIVWLFVVSHSLMIDSNYNKFKKLRASWLVLLGIWTSHAKHEAKQVFEHQQAVVVAEFGKWRDAVTSSRPSSRQENRDRGSDITSDTRTTETTNPERQSLLDRIDRSLNDTTVTVNNDNDKDNNQRQRNNTERRNNNIRKVLNLRLDASQALDSFLSIDNNENDVRLLDDNRLRLRQQLVQWGAKLPVFKPKSRTRGLSS